MNATVITEEEKTTVLNMFDTIIQEWGERYLSGEEKALFVKLGGELKE